MFLNILFILLISSIFYPSQLNFNENIVNKESNENIYKFNLKNKGKNYRELKIYGPFSFNDKILAAELLAKILCKNDEKEFTRYIFEFKAKEKNLPNGITNSYEVIKAGNLLNNYLESKCETDQINQRIKKEIYDNSFKFNK